MEKDSNIKISEINVDGGMADNKKFIQNLSNILQIRIIKPKNVEASALGAAFLASLNNENFNNLDQLIKNKKYNKDIKNYNPKIKKSLIEKKLLRWQKAVSALINYHD